MKTFRLSVLLMTIAALCACETTRTPKAPPTPPPTYTGPEFFRATVGSVCTLSGYKPTLVSGYGLVVNLDGTGSSDVPPQIAQWLRNEMSRGGFGKRSLGHGHMTPDQVIMSNRTAVVKVEGLVPPGAVPGTPFDVMVSAIPGTQTTSLEGGLLYTTDLRFGGTSSRIPSSRPLGRAYGPIFLNPFISANPTALGGRDDNPRVGRICNGAIAVEAAPLALILRQPSFGRARQVADRINGRFRRADADKYALAVAKDDSTIHLNVLQRFKHNPQRMLDLIGHLYLNPTEQFAREQVKRLMVELAKPANRRHADGIVAALEGMGRLIVPVLRESYHHDNRVVRLAALSAGARLGDLGYAAEPLAAMAQADSGAESERATAMLGVLLGHSPDHTRIRAMLRHLLDSEDNRVRMTAFSALFNAGERGPYIIHRSFPGKFELALVNSSKQMVYVTRQGPPRIVIFDQMLGYNYPLFASLWNNRFMVRGDKDDLTIGVYHRAIDASNGQTEQIAPTVGNLLLLMANQRVDGNTLPGFDMGYGQVVKVLHELTQNGAISAPLVLQSSDLVQRINRERSGRATEGRPERSETNGSGSF